MAGRAGPGDSRGGPLVTDRPTAENPGEKFTAERTPQDPRASRRDTRQPGASIRLDTLECAARAGEARSRRELVDQLERAVQQRQAAGDREGARLAAAWASEARGAA